MVTAKKSFNFKPAEIAFYALCFLAVHFLSDRFQAPLTFHGGTGWDGTHYYKVAEQISRGEPIREEAPFCYRPGAPWLACLLSPHDLIRGFKLSDIGFNVLLLVCFVLLTAQFIDNWKIRCLLAGLLMTHWIGPFRALYWYPVNTDNSGFFFIVLGALCLHLTRTRPVIGTLCTGLTVFVGILFREPTLVFAAAIFFVQNPIRFEEVPNALTSLKFQKIVSFPRLIFAAPLVFGIASFALCHVLAHKTNNYTAIRMIVNTLYNNPWFSMIHAAFIAFGPLLVLVLWDWKQTCRFFASNQALLVFMILSVAMAHVGGFEPERYLFYTMPVTYVLIGLALARHWELVNSKALLAVFAVTQMLAQRLFWTLPDFPNDFRSRPPILTVPGNHFPVLDLLTLHGARAVQLVGLAEYGLLAAGLLLWLNHRAAGLRNNSAADAGAKSAIADHIGVAVPSQRLGAMDAVTKLRG